MTSTTPTDSKCPGCGGAVGADGVCYTCRSTVKAAAPEKKKRSHRKRSDRNPKK